MRSAPFLGSVLFVCEFFAVCTFLGVSFRARPSTASLFCLSVSVLRSVPFLGSVSVPDLRPRIPFLFVCVCLAVCTFLGVSFVCLRVPCSPHLSRGQFCLSASFLRSAPFAWSFSAPDLRPRIPFGAARIIKTKMYCGCKDYFCIFASRILW